MVASVERVAHSFRRFRGLGRPRGPQRSEAFIIRICQTESQSGGSLVAICFRAICIQALCFFEELFARPCKQIP